MMTRRMRWAWHVAYMGKGGRKRRSITTHYVYVVGRKARRNQITKKTKR
jgi:hypothetical protein